jgi:hypothetical protein
VDFNTKELVKLKQLPYSYGKETVLRTFLLHFIIRTELLWKQKFPSLIVLDIFTFHNPTLATISSALSVFQG